MTVRTSFKTGTILLEKWSRERLRKFPSPANIKSLPIHRKHILFYAFINLGRKYGN